jgi:hypothetical protein
MSELKIKIDEEEVKVNSVKIQKMAFLYHALDHGWTIKKVNNNKYEFDKPGFKKIEVTNLIKEQYKIKELLK